MIIKNRYIITIWLYKQAQKMIYLIKHIYVYFITAIVSFNLF